MGLWILGINKCSKQIESTTGSSEKPSFDLRLHTVVIRTFPTWATITGEDPLSSLA